MRRQSSRARFDQYERGLTERQTEQARPADSARADRVRGSRKRSQRALIASFFKFLRPVKGRVALALFAFTLSTLMILVPAAATKLVVDYVLPGKTSFELMEYSIPLPTKPWQGLLLVCFGIFMISVLKISFDIWGRWNAFQTAKQLELTIRKQVFGHAIRLPFQRLQQLKTGGGRRASYERMWPASETWLFR